MEKFIVHMWLEPVSIVVSAKNKRAAKKKAYDRMKKKTAYSFIDKKDTDVQD